MNAVLPVGLRRLGWRVWALELVGLAVLWCLGFVWLEIPDSHVWELLLSLLFAAAIVGAAVWIQAWVVRALRRCVRVSPIWLSCGVLAGWLLLWWGLAVAAGHLGDKTDLRAGYWNSQMSPAWRVRLPFERLQAWQTDVIAAIVWWVIPALLLPFLVETVACGGWRGELRTAARVLRSWWHWVVTAVAAWVGVWATDKLVAWHPTYTVRGELVSVVLRVGAAYAVDVALLLVVLAVVAELLRRSELREDVRRKPVV